MAPYTSLRTLTILAAASLLLVPARSQQTSGQQTSTPSTGSTSTGSTTTGGAGSVGRTPTTTPTITSPNNQQSGQNPMQMPEMRRPVFLSGRVMLDDGTPPSEMVVIERICAGSGTGRPEAYTDSKGRFNFELGQNSSIFADASVATVGGFDRMGGSSTGMLGPSLSDRQLSTCEIRAVLPGFRSDSVSLADHRSMDNPDIGTIVLHRLGKVDGRVISATSLNAPKDARKAYEKGLDLVKRKKLGEAEKSFQKAVDSYPKYAAAWYELGQIEEAQEQNEAARKSYEQATAADPKYINPWLQLSGIAARQHNYQELAEFTDRAIKLDPFDYPQAYFLNSLAHYNLKHFEAAEKSAREAQKLDNRHVYPQTAHLLGVLLAQRRDYRAAAEQMRMYLSLAPKTSDTSLVRKQLAELEKLTQAAEPTGAAPQP